MTKATEAGLDPLEGRWLQPQGEQVGRDLLADQLCSPVVDRARGRRAPMGAGAPDS